MNILLIDEAIERYVRERKVRNADEAAARFLSYVHIRFSGKELGEFLDLTSRMIRYYINLFQILVNPLKGPEFAFFAAAVAVAVFGCLLLRQPGEQLPGILLIAGALVHARSIIGMAIRKWCDLSVLIAVYHELLTLAEKELIAVKVCPGEGWNGSRKSA